MSVFYSSESVTILAGDCVDEMRTLPDASVHAIVTDPPYGLEFMGREWDTFGRNTSPGYREAPRITNRPDAVSGFSGAGGVAVNSYQAGTPFQAWCETWAVEALRVLKPGGHLLAFGGTRTFHRLAAAVEDAGFEIRDSIAWLYGSGFPKSTDIAKTIDKRAGHWRGRAGDVLSENPSMENPNYSRTEKGEPVTEEARKWAGWGTALKPAFEPIVVARKPFRGAVVDNVLRHGTGALNIDATRVETDEVRVQGAQKATGATPFGGVREGGKVYDDGRYPMNVALDGSQAAVLDEQSGATKSPAPYAGEGYKGSSMFGLGGVNHAGEYGDSGGASRFFPTFRYRAKAPGHERPMVDGEQHPTVKPLELMRWLVRLVTPPGGTVLEPFAGSGTTVEACIREGFSCIAIERDPQSLAFVVKRIHKDHQQTLFGDWGDE